MDNLGNFLEFLRLFLILIIAGTAFKVSISLIRGEKVVVNPLNPLNLKARWPRNTKDNDSKK